jgi:hypothetical protein
MLFNLAAFQVVLSDPAVTLLLPFRTYKTSIADALIQSQ